MSQENKNLSPVVQQEKRTLENIMWNESTKPALIKTFQLGDEPELLHIIKTGFKDKYFVLREDAYETFDCKAEFLTSSQIKEKYDIIIK